MRRIKVRQHKRKTKKGKPTVVKQHLRDYKRSKLKQAKLIHYNMYKRHLIEAMKSLKKAIDRGLILSEIERKTISNLENLSGIYEEQLGPYEKILKSL